MRNEPLRPPAPEEAAALRQALAAADFTDKGLTGKLGDVSLPTPRTRNLPRLMRLTAGGSPRDTLARLFLFGVRVPEEAVRAALAPLPPESLYRMGLAEPCGGQVEANVVLYPYGGLLVVFDRPDKVVAGAPRDLVMGITSSSLDVAHMVVPWRVRNALDMGTGCGVLAFLAAAHAGHVCAVDASPRAVNFARFAAALNGLDNVECLEGDRFEPVRGRRFDLIVGNLPFVIAPSSSYLYRDGGMGMEGFARSMLGSAPQYLEEGGWCHVLCEWAHVAGEDWRQRLAGWFEGSGCDVFAIKLSTANPMLYAEVWIRDTEKDDPESFARTYGEWTDWYAANRIEAISTGLIAMRRRSGGGNWLRMDDFPGHAPEGFGKHVAQRFALYDFLEGAGSGEKLLDCRLAVSRDVRLQAKNEWTPGGWRVAGARLYLESLPPFAGDIGSQAGHLLAYCDGERTLREAMARLAADLRAEPARVAELSMPMVRELVGRGFLIPRELAGDFEALGAQAHG